MDKYNDSSLMSTYDALVDKITTLEADLKESRYRLNYDEILKFEQLIATYYVALAQLEAAGHIGARI